MARPKSFWLAYCKIQLLAGMRPGEDVIMRGIDLDTMSNGSGASALSTRHSHAWNALITNDFAAAASRAAPCLESAAPPAREPRLMYARTEPWL